MVCVPAHESDSWRAQWLQETTLTIDEPRVWRGVETQHVSSTALLVDSADEHELLEEMLEQSKPALPAAPETDVAGGLEAKQDFPSGRSAVTAGAISAALPQETSPARRHYLLTTPFRYTPFTASRFRPAGMRGIWYGARELRAACAELAYWRSVFVRDSAGLASDRVLSRLTFFAASVSGIGIDLMAPPWVAARASWTRNADYSETHRLAAAARRTGIEVIRYESVRSPGDANLAVFTPAALDEPQAAPPFAPHGRSGIRGSDRTKTTGCAPLHALSIDATRQAWSCLAAGTHAWMWSDSDPAKHFEWSW